MLLEGEVVGREFVQGSDGWMQSIPVSEVLIRNLPQGNQSLYAGNAVWKSQQEEPNVNVEPEKTSEITLMHERVR